MTFLDSLSLSVPPDIVDTITTIANEPIDINTILSNPAISSVYTPLIIFYVFFIVFFVFYTVFRWCVCCEFKILSEENVFRLFIVFNLVSVSALALIINGNLRIVFGYEQTVLNIEKVLDVFRGVFNTTAECEMISNSSFYIEIEDQLDSIDTIIEDVDVMFNDYSPYYFTVSHVVSGISMGFLIGFMIIIFFQRKMRMSLKWPRIGSETIIIFLLFIQVILVVAFRSASFGGTAICIPGLVDNAVGALDSFDLGTDIEELITFYMVCEDPSDTPAILDELPINMTFLDLAEDNGLLCYPNNSLYCANQTLCAGIGDISDYDFFCSCEDFLVSIQDIFFDCTTIKNIVSLIEEAICGHIAEPLAQIYISSMLYIYSISMVLILYSIYENMYFK